MSDMRLDETGYKCPKCGNEVDFTASHVWVLFEGVHITPDGWDWADRPVTCCDMHDECTLLCGSCGHREKPAEFEECWESKEADDDD